MCAYLILLLAILPSEARITLNKQKCVFKTEEIAFADHVVGKDGTKTDSRKVEAIMMMP